MAGAVASVRVRCWTAGLPTPLVAVMVTSYEPRAVAGGVPEMVAVPLVWAVKTRPGGRVPDRLGVGAGGPVAVSVKVLGPLETARRLAALVMTGPPYRLSSSIDHQSLVVPAFRTTLTDLAVWTEKPTISGVAVPVQVATVVHEVPPAETWTS